MVWLYVCYAHLVGRCVQAFGPAFFQMNVSCWWCWTHQSKQAKEC
jgi:hypothetical protein